MKKIVAALAALALIATPAIAGKNKNHNHNYWQGKKHNYWHGNKNNYWIGGGIYYNSPNFWGGISGGSYNYYNYRQYNYRSNCHIEYAPRCVQGLGCTPVEVYVCN